MDSERDYLDYYSDDPEIIEDRSTSKFARFLKYLALGSMVVIGTTSAANININTNSSREFGQGIALYASCSKSDYITVNPIESFDPGSD